jgi:Amt family ammonium transporter
MSTAVISFQWFFWGYSLAFSKSAGPFIGDFANFGLRNVLAHPSLVGPRIPDILFCVYQGMFACITYV